MTKHEFLKTLKTELDANQVRNVSEILQDYEEHFNHGQMKGKSESEISSALGSPIVIARAYKTETMIAEIKNDDNQFRWGLALNVILRLLVLAPFNFIVLFIPGLLVFSLIVAGWSVAMAFGSAGLAVLWYIPSMLSVSSTFWMGLAGVSGTIGLLGLAMIGFMIMFFITKHVVLALISYLQWNLKFVMEK